MLEGYFTSLRFSDDFLKEGKVYVKTTDKDKIAPPPPTTTQCPGDEDDEDDVIKTDLKVTEVSTEPQTVNESQNQQQQHQQVLISNLNASNIQIISGVQARVQQYKCAMQVNIELNLIIYIFTCNLMYR